MVRNVLYAFVLPVNRFERFALAPAIIVDIVYDVPALAFTESVEGALVILLFLCGKTRIVHYLVEPMVNSVIPGAILYFLPLITRVYAPSEFTFTFPFSYMISVVMFPNASFSIPCRQI